MTQDTKIEAVGHTAGPWHYDEKHGWIYHQQAVLTTYIIANMESGNEANARLIAAAPDLLKALKLMLLHSCVADAAPEDKDDDDHLAERLAYRAIAKAEGRVS